MTAYTDVVTADKRGFPVWVSIISQTDGSDGTWFDLELKSMFCKKSITAVIDGRGTSYVRSSGLNLHNLLGDLKYGTDPHENIKLVEDKILAWTPETKAFWF